MASTYFILLFLSPFFWLCGTRCLHHIDSFSLDMSIHFSLLVEKEQSMPLCHQLRQTFACQLAEQ